MVPRPPATRGGPDLGAPHTAGNAFRPETAWVWHPLCKSIAVGVSVRLFSRGEQRRPLRDDLPRRPRGPPQGYGRLATVARGDPSALPDRRPAANLALLPGVSDRSVSTPGRN